MNKNDFKENEARFRKLAFNLGVTSFCCHGELGTFEGSVDDLVVHGSYLREGTWSASMLELLQDGLFPNGEGTFLDVGANIGLVSIPLAEKRNVSCLAFEPEPTNFSLLESNILRHGVDSLIKAFNVALYSEETEIRLERSPSNSGDNRLKPGQSPRSEGIGEDLGVQVTALPLDSLVDPESLPRPIVMKMDTQGAEVRVLEGAQRVLSKVDYLISEYWPRGLLMMGDSAERFWTLIKEFPFGAVLSQTSSEVSLQAVEEMSERLRWVPTDGSDDGFFDILVTRHHTLPGLTSETSI